MVVLSKPTQEVQHGVFVTGFFLHELTCSLLLPIRTGIANVSIT